MKLNLLPLLLSLLAFTFSVQAQTAPTDKPVDPAPQEKSSTAAYPDLLAKLKEGDTKIDYRALRMAYTQTKEYSPYGTGSDETTPMFKALNDKKYKDALKLAEEILKDNYVEMNSHYVASLAHESLGNKEKAEFHKAVFLGLVNSIIGGKDGKSAKTAYEVISVPEEYVIVNILKYQRGSQSLVNEDGHKFDVLTVTHRETKETVRLYFNVDLVFKGYEKIFGK